MFSALPLKADIDRKGRCVFSRAPRNRRRVSDPENIVWSISAPWKLARLKLQPFIRTSENTLCEKSVSEQSALKKLADDIRQRRNFAPLNSAPEKVISWCFGPKKSLRDKSARTRDAS